MRLRRRLDTGAPDDFPVLTDLRAEGMTDYVARLVRFDGGDTRLPRGDVRVEDPARPDPLQGIFFSAATDVPGGFDDGHLKQVADALPYLALAVKSRSTLDVARTLLETYLGADAGGHVLTGEIDRHSVQRIRAVIWFCDLRGFSSVASRVPQEELVEILDAYLEAMARPVLDHRGQILKFLGDGFLATFDLAQRRRESVCVDALAAAVAAARVLPALQCGAPRRREEDAGIRRRAAPGRGALREHRRERAARFHGRGIGGERGEPHRRDVPAAAAQGAGVTEPSTRRR